MTVFRPCIDLHNGQVKQIVGGTLTDAGPGPVTNFEASQGAAHFADLYRTVRHGVGSGVVENLSAGVPK